MDDPQQSNEPLSGTKLHKALGTSAGEAIATAISAGTPLGLVGLAAKVANIAAVTIICAGMIFAFMWQRDDARADRTEYRQQVVRQEQLTEERRREDRQDRQRTEELFRTTLESIGRDNRESVMQMKLVSEQVRLAGEQMKMATESMVRLEKMLSLKQPPAGP